MSRVAVKRRDVRPGTPFSYGSTLPFNAIALDPETGHAINVDGWSGAAKLWHVYLPTFSLGCSDPTTTVYVSNDEAGLSDSEEDLGINLQPPTTVNL